MLLKSKRFEGATDTTTGLLKTYIVMSVSYPHVFKAAQAELDKICGDHPPTADDLFRSEYVKAMCKETLRWYGMFAFGILDIFFLSSLYLCTFSLIRPPPSIHCESR